MGLKLNPSKSFEKSLRNAWTYIKDSLTPFRISPSVGRKGGRRSLDKTTTCCCEVWKTDLWLYQRSREVILATRCRTNSNALRYYSVMMSRHKWMSWHWVASQKRNKKKCLLTGSVEILLVRKVREMNDFDRLSFYLDCAEPCKSKFTPCDIWILWSVRTVASLSAMYFKNIYCNSLSSVPPLF